MVWIYGEVVGWVVMDCFGIVVFFKTALTTARACKLHTMLRTKSSHTEDLYVPEKEWCTLAYNLSRPETNSGGIFLHTSR